MKFVLSAAFACLGTAALAQQAFEPSLARAVAQAQLLREAAVEVSATLAKPVKMSDVMFRRPRGADMVIRTDYKTTSCKGTLDQSLTRVYVPTVCVAQEGYTLAKLTLVFANGIRAQGTQNTVQTLGEVSFVRTSVQSTKGLHGLVFEAVPNGQSLQRTFGEQMGEYLLSFFRRRGVSAHRTRLRIGAVVRGAPTLQVGEPFLYNGKVVALVQEIPATLKRGFWGDVPEDALAIIRS